MDFAAVELEGTCLRQSLICKRKTCRRVTTLSKSRLTCNHKPPTMIRRLQPLQFMTYMTTSRIDYCIGLMPADTRPCLLLALQSSCTHLWASDAGWQRCSKQEWRPSACLYDLPPFQDAHMP